MFYKLENGNVSYLLLLLLCLMPYLRSQAQTISTDKPAVKTVDLNWKLAPDDTLRYLTVMTDIEESTFEIDFGGVFDQLVDDSTQTNGNKLATNFFEEFREVYNKIDFVTLITNSEVFEDVLEVELIGLPSEEEDQSFMTKMMQGTMLRGSIYKKGPLHSFWVKTNQKNILSILFELPDKPLAEGESWTLNNVNFIANDHNFTCSKASRHNTATLTSIRVEAGETIVTVEYDIREYVVGEFKAPSFIGGEQEGRSTTMDFIFRGQAEFSIEQGKWLTYNGILSLDGTGRMKTSQRQKIALFESEN